MAEETIPKIPKKNPNDGSAWQTGDTYLTGGKTYILNSKGKWIVPKTTAAEQEIVDSATDAYLSQTKTGLPAGQEKPDSYDLTTQPKYILAKMGDVQRKKILKELYIRGQYGGSKMQNGLGTSDIGAFQDLLYYANVKGKPWQQAFDLYKKEFPAKTSLVPGAGRVAPKQVSSPDDLKAVFKKVSQELLGRSVDSETANEFVAAFQKQQISMQTKLDKQSGGTVQQTPDASLVAEKMIGKKYGGELRVQRAVNFGSIMDEMIKGLAR